MKNKQLARKIAEQVSTYGGSVYYVGGLVRDGILGRENKDVDIEVHGVSAQVLEEILKKLGTPTVMGASFGIYGMKGYELDIALPRAEDGARRGKEDFAEYADPFVGPEKAAMRRDFTMNALMQDVLTGEILDFFGGVDDLKNGVVRHVAEQTFREDPLRVLRAAQFAARFGFEIAEETISLCASLDLSQLARERIFGELEKALLKSPRPSVFFRYLRQMHQLSCWFPEVEALIDVEQAPCFHPEGDVWTHTMMVLDLAATLRSQAKEPLAYMLSALCHDFGKVTASKMVDGRIRATGHELEGIPVAERFLKRLTNEIQLRKYVMNMVELHMRPNLMVQQKSSKKAYCKLFDASVCPEDLLLLAKADTKGRGMSVEYDQDEQYLRGRLAEFHEVMARPFVKGADLVALGYQPGPDFKEVLEYAHKLRLAGVDKENALRQTVGWLNHLRNIEVK